MPRQGPGQSGPRRRSRVATHSVDKVAHAVASIFVSPKTAPRTHYAAATALKRGTFDPFNKGQQARLKRAAASEARRIQQQKRTSLATRGRQVEQAQERRLQHAMRSHARTAALFAAMPQDAPTRFLQDLGNAAIYSVPGAIHAGATVARDVGTAAHGDFSFKRSRRLGEQIGRSTYQDIQHPLRHPGYALLDALAVASVGAGAVARAGAVGRELAAGGGLRAAGKATVLRPKAYTFKVGDLEVDKPLSRNQLIAAGQRVRYRGVQRRLDQGAPAHEPGTTLGRGIANLTSPETVVGNEIRAARRVEKAYQAAPLVEHARDVAPRFKRRLSRGENAALAVLGVEGHGALDNPGQVIARHIATHRRYIAEGADVAANQSWITNLKLAGKALHNPSPRLLAAYDATRRLANTGEAELVQRGLLSRAQAEGRKAAIAGVYGHKAGHVPEGSYFFTLADRGLQGLQRHAGGRFYSPRPKATGVPPPDAGRMVPGIKQRFTGRATRKGLPLNMPQVVAHGYARRLHLVSAHDFYGTLLQASHDVRRSEYDVPIRSTRTIPKQLKDALQKLEQHAASNPTPDEAAALSHAELKALADHLQADEHARAAVGQSVKGVRWVDRRLIKDLGENQVRGPVEKLADAINNPLRVGALYLRPAYLLNLLGNAGMLGVSEGRHGIPAINDALRSHAIHGSRNTAVIDSLMGASRSRGFSVDTGPLGRASHGLAEFWNTITDLHSRRQSFFHSARLSGYNTPEKINALLHDPALKRERNLVVRRANKDIVDYTLTPAEQQTIRRLIYFYPWVSRGSLWALRAEAEHPVKGVLLAQSGRPVEAQAKKILGAVPSWLEGAIPAGPQRGGKVPVRNFSSLNTYQTAQQTADALIQTGAALGNLPHRPGSKGIGELLTPAAQLLASSTGGGTSHGGIMGALEGTAPYQLARRLGKVGKPSKTYPDTGLGPAFGPFTAGGLYPRNVSVQAVHKDAYAEMRPAQRVAAQTRDLHQTLIVEGRRNKFLKPDEKLPPELERALRLNQQRATAIAKAHARTSRDRYHVDIELLVKMGAMDPADSNLAFKWANHATDAQIRSERAKITKGYFDPPPEGSQQGWLHHAVKVLKDKGVDVSVPG